MKHIFYIIFVLGFSLISHEQEISNPFNEKMNEVVQTQVLNNLKINVPILFVGTNLFFYYNYEITNSKIYFTDNVDNKLKNTFKFIVEDEFSNSFHFNFFPNTYLDTTLILKAYNDDRILFNLTYSNTKNKQKVKIELLNKSFMNETIYENHLLKSSLLKRNEVYFYDSFEYGESLIRNLKYDTESRKYELIEEKYQDKRIKSKTFYKRSKDKNSKRINKMEKYFYDLDGKIKRIERLNKRQKMTSSTEYYYNDTLLSTIINKKDNVQKTIYFYYDKQSRLIKKDILTEGNKFVIKYAYTKKGQIKDVDIQSNSKSKRFEFFYNTKDRLLSLSIYKKQFTNEIYKLTKQYNFTYSTSKGNLLFLREMTQEGVIKKEVNYLIDYIKE